MARHDGQSCPFYSIKSFCLKCFDPTLSSLFEMDVPEILVSLLACLLACLL